MQHMAGQRQAGKETRDRFTGASCVQEHRAGWGGALVGLMLGLPQVYELPFLVVLDHKKESVVVAVRGTMSLQVRS